MEIKNNQLILNRDDVLNCTQGFNDPTGYFAVLALFLENEAKENITNWMHQLKPQIPHSHYKITKCNLCNGNGDHPGFYQYAVECPSCHSKGFIKTELKS